MTNTAPKHGRYFYTKIYTNISVPQGALLLYIHEPESLNFRGKKTELQGSDLQGKGEVFMYRKVIRIPMQFFADDGNGAGGTGPQKNDRKQPSRMVSEGAVFVSYSMHFVHFNLF